MAEVEPQFHASASLITSRLVGVAICLPIIATIATVLRLYARKLKGDGRFQADDWTTIIALVFCYAHSINTLVTAGIGGINTITVPPQDYVNIALRALFISSFFLITALYVVKVAILLFYYRLFSVSHRFKRAVIILSVILSIWWLVNITLDLLATDPVDAAWKDAARAHHRFDFNDWYLAYSGFSIFFDIVILCFPIPMISSLRVNTRQKFSILAIFWLGGFICISAIVRFVFFYRSAYRLTDVGHNDYSLISNSFIWAEVEPNTSVIASCLPTYGPLFREGGLFPRLLGSAIHMSHRRRGDESHANLDYRYGREYIEFDRTVSCNLNTDTSGMTSSKKPIIRVEACQQNTEAKSHNKTDVAGIGKARTSH